MTKKEKLLHEQQLLASFWNGFITGMAMGYIPVWKLLFEKFPIPHISKVLEQMEKDKEES